MAALLMVGLVVLVPLLFLAVMYNRLVGVRNHCLEAWHNIDTELKRRYDLIPNLVRCVKGYAAHEREVLEQVTRLRQEAMANTGSPEQQARSENKLVRALNLLYARIEAYPDLKASGNFLHLQRELVNTEDRIQAARRFYNGNVREMNNLVQMFPTNLIAQMFGFGLREYFQVEEAHRAVPEASL
ncbi:MAG: LemA family protein [Planctomycetota bacterium]